MACFPANIEIPDVRRGIFNVVASWESQFPDAAPPTTRDHVIRD